jgi:hypothetical protein
MKKDNAETAYCQPVGAGALPSSQPVVVTAGGTAAASHPSAATGAAKFQWTMKASPCKLNPMSIFTAPIIKTTINYNMDTEKASDLFLTTAHFHLIPVTD